MVMVASAQARAQDCAGDPAYPLDCSGATLGANCGLTESDSTLPTGNDAVWCDWTGGANAVDVKAVFCDSATCGADEIHVFGTDAESDTFCCILSPVKTSPNNGDWWIRLEGTGGNDTFVFNHNGYTLQSYDTSSGGPAMVISMDTDGGDDTVTLPQGHPDYEGREIELGAGDDTLTGGIGNDTVWGGDGEDVVDGDGGDDRIDGGNDPDDLTGGAGDDTLCAGAYAGGSAPRDQLDAGIGNDTLWGGDSGGGGQSDLTCGNGTDDYGGAGGGSVAADCENNIFTAPAFCP